VPGSAPSSPQRSCGHSRIVWEAARPHSRPARNRVSPLHDHRDPACVFRRTYSSACRPRPAGALTRPGLAAGSSSVSVLCELCLACSAPGVDEARHPAGSAPTARLSRSWRRPMSCSTSARAKRVERLTRTRGSSPAAT